jgi:hypothetical protein
MQIHSHNRTLWNKSENLFSLFFKKKKKNDLHYSFPALELFGSRRIRDLLKWKLKEKSLSSFVFNERRSLWYQIKNNLDENKQKSQTCT